MKKLLKICQEVLALLLALAGAGSMPSGMGGICMLLAMLMAPTDSLVEILEKRWFRWFGIGALLVCLSCLPLADAERAGQYLGWRMHIIWQAIQSIGG